MDRDGRPDAHRATRDAGAASTSRRHREDEPRDRDSRRDRDQDRDRVRDGERDKDRSRRRRSASADSESEWEREERRRRRRKEKDRERDGDRSKGRDERERSRSRDRGDRDRERGKDRDRRKDDRERDRKSRKRKDSRSPSPSDRLRRKEAKAALKAASRAEAARELENDQSRAAAELSMYTGADNPFHDANIGEQFVWKKKRDKERRAGLSLEDIARKDAQRRLEAQEELSKLNKKRADREVEMALREEEDARQARLAEDAQMREWIDREDDFQLEQARRRAGIRLKEQRAKAIDFLAINLRFADARTVGRHTAAIGMLANPRKYEAEREEEEEGWGWADAGFEFEIDEPWRIFDNLNLEDCEELEQDIKMYISLEKSAINLEFWDAMQIVCSHHLEALRDPEHAAGGRLFNKDVDDAAGKIVAGLSHTRLVELEAQTHAMLRSGQPVDGEFWDLVLKKIDMEKAVARLNAIHEVVLKNRLEQFRKRQREDAEKATATASRGALPPGPADAGNEADEEPEDDDEEDQDEDADDDEDDWVEEYDPEMSPPPADPGKMVLDDRRLPLVELDDHLRSIYAARRALISTVRARQALSGGSSTAPAAQGQVHTSATALQASAADLEAERIARAEAVFENDLETDQSEEEFGDLDEAIDGVATGTTRGGGATSQKRRTVQTLDWTDRYRPRKPRYFNRVHTGYEWNRYNQMHYDTENPPPKVVQGYKFNIFYPDLIDKTKAPTYRLIKIPDDNDTQIILFQAGPPYEDVAFRMLYLQFNHMTAFS